MVVSLLHRRKDSTVRVSNTQTSSLIVEETNQTIHTSRMRRNSQEGIRSTRTA